MLPSYKEEQALPQLLSEIIQAEVSGGVVVVVDDSPSEISERIRRNCIEVFSRTSLTFFFIGRAKKSGRGSAVRHGMEFLQREFPSLPYIIEADTDGSHSADDIVRLILENNEWDIVIGSRYLSQSKIIGWSRTRRLFSTILNSIVPRLLRLPISDITNGLRRYSTKAIQILLSSPQKNDGFIYLSEQLVRLDGFDLRIKEIPTTFHNRKTGESSVSLRLILESLAGLLFLIFLGRNS